MKPNQAQIETERSKYRYKINTNKVMTGDPDDQDDEQVDDWGSEFRCGEKRMLGSVVKMTKTEWSRQTLTII